MPLRQEWSEFQREMVWGCWLALEKKGVRKVAEITGIPKSTCNEIIKMYKEEGLTKAPPREGRPPILTPRDQRHLALTVEKNPMTPIAVIREEFVEASGTQVSISTLRRALPLLGYHACAGARKPWVSPVNRTIRLKWCRDHADWDGAVETCHLD